MILLLLLLLLLVVAVVVVVLALQLYNSVESDLVLTKYVEKWTQLPQSASNLHSLNDQQGVSACQ